MSARPPAVTRPRARSTFALFRKPPFVRLWLAAVAYSFAQWIEIIAVGWFVFDQTDSAFVTAAAVAAQSAPSIVFGTLAGTIADRSPRPRVLAASALLKAAALGVVALIALADSPPIGLLIGTIAVSGVARAFQLSALHTLSGDLADAGRDEDDASPTQRPRAISLVSLGQRVVAAAGSLTSGLVISAFGVQWTFAMAAAALVLAAVLHASVREPRAHGTAGSRPSLLADVGEGLAIVRRYRMVALLLGVMIGVEIFGFAYNSLLPALANRVLEVGATRLGALGAATGSGAVVGMLALSLAADRVRHGFALTAVVGTFGAMLVAIGLSQVFVLSLGFAAILGACMASTDALQWIMLQAAVPEHLRGRALGAWNMTIGFGWIGPLGLGALADATSVTTAFVLAGSVLIGLAAVLAATPGGVRSA